MKHGHIGVKSAKDKALALIEYRIKIAKVQKRILGGRVTGDRERAIEAWLRS